MSKLAEGALHDKKTHIPSSLLFEGGEPPSPVLPGSGSMNTEHIKPTVSKPTEGKDLCTIQISSAPR